VSPGAVLAGRYRLDDQLASGGMAQVWRGTDEVLRRSIAVKILHAHLAADETFVTRFRHEAIAVARLSHPAIVNVYDTCTENGIDAIVMELVRGNTLRDRLDQGPIEPSTAANIAAQVAGALDVAHAAGLVHRDIKPANILLSEDGRVKVGDFGIAKAAESADLTETGSFVGTAKYLAPEQVESKPVDGRTDLYSLGVVLYEMLTGRVPFEADSASGTALARLHTDPVPVRQLNPRVPPALEGITMRLLARDPNGRFPSAADARAALLGAGADDRASDADHADGTMVGAPLPPPPVGTRPATSGAPLPPPGPTYDPITPGAGGVVYRDNERRKLVPILLVVLVAVALAVAGLLLQRAAGGDDEDGGDGGGTSDTTSGEAAAPSEQVALEQTFSFDPQGDGGESPNDAERNLAIDGDPGTAWETERYNTPDFGRLKAGVGLIATLSQPGQVRAVEIDSPSGGGWTADIYIGNDSGDGGLEAWGEPVASIQSGPDGGTITSDTFDREGDAVLVWITFLGEGNPQNRVELAEIRALR
jgi:serine/threonine-protein kinase